jgi:hypothetical protein
LAWGSHGTGRMPENVLIQSLAHDPEKWMPVFGKDHAQTIG